MNITLSQDTFYSLNVNKNLVLEDIITYYLYLFGYFTVSTSFLYFIIKINNIVDGYFEHTDTEVGAENNIEDDIPYEMKWFDEFDDNEDSEDSEDSEEEDN